MILRGSRSAPIPASVVGMIVIISMASGRVQADDFAVPLPGGAQAVWDLEKASRETTPTRQRICLNGLWRWQPAREDAADLRPPAATWGYYKVPGCWPGITDYMQKDCQTLFSHPTWKSEALGRVKAAWYERELEVPSGWVGRSIALSAEYVNSIASAFVDGTHAGEIRFPGGELDVTSRCRPGKRHVLSLLVRALPLRAVMLSYTDTAAAREVKGSVGRRGLCGDVYLVSTPHGPRINQVKIDTWVRGRQITVGAGLSGLLPGANYSLRARVRQGSREVVELSSPKLLSSDAQNGRFSFTTSWMPDRLWDLNTPGNVYSLSLSLADQDGKVLDTACDERFAFREFWIDGRDFYLNGTRIFLSSVPIDNALVSALAASYDATRESLTRLKSFGINMVYTHNYGCEPGSHLSYAEVLRAADDVGMLVSFSEPHFSHYDWKSPDADRTNGYLRHAEFYTRAALNHPSVVFYSMSHNATGYDEDMNPEMIDGLHDPRASWAKNNTNLALRAEAIVRQLDPGRIVYHHASGNLGSMHAINFYPNFAPVQELSDWFEHWSSKGVKPVFTCEYGAPFTWDFSMYRGWYKGQRSFGSAAVPWEFCFAEWNAQFLGDRAYRLTEMEKANLRWEAKQSKAGRRWHRWDYPYELGSPRFDDRHEVIGMYLEDNLRAFRTWGVSATSPWEYGHFWRPREGLKRSRRELKVDWNAIQRPGFSADYLDQPFERMDMAFERSDWTPTADAQALLRNNRPLLAYIGGKRARFTSKDHNFVPGETVEKQLIIVNNSRETITCDCEWRLELGDSRVKAAHMPFEIGGRTKITVNTGQQARVPIAFELPHVVGQSTFRLNARADFGKGEIQDDSFAIHVLPGATPPRTDARIALFDPPGETRTLLLDLAIGFTSIDAGANLSEYDTLIVGKGALTVPGRAPSIAGVRNGLKVIVFEQTAAVLEKRLGFRVAEYGLRQVFPRVVDHPILSALGAFNLRDWRGAATISSPRLDYELRPRYGPTVRWCDIPVPRVWRCGNQGNVASVLIEKPACGSFLPISDGGFSLQYSPLLEYREGRGLIVFCQLDVTGRTENDPAAKLLARNLLSYVTNCAPRVERSIAYAGDAAGLRHLESAGFLVSPFQESKLSAGHLLVAGPGAGKTLAASAAKIAQWLQDGGYLLAIGLDDADANAFMPFRVTTKTAEHISAHFDSPGRESLLAGVGPADVHNRDPRNLPLLQTGATVLGDGILARAEGSNVVFCQLVPWQFEDLEKPNVKRTFRRASFLVALLLANMGASGATPVLARFGTPVDAAKPEKRWLSGLYLDQPEEMDDPYRFFRW